MLWGFVFRHPLRWCATHFHAKSDTILMNKGNQISFRMCRRSRDDGTYTNFRSNVMWRQRRKFHSINWVSRQVMHVTLSVALKLFTSVFYTLLRINNNNTNNRIVQQQMFGTVKVIDRLSWSLIVFNVKITWNLLNKENKSKEIHINKASNIFVSLCQCKFKVIQIQVQRVRCGAFDTWKKWQNS